MSENNNHAVATRSVAQRRTDALLDGPAGDVPEDRGAEERFLACCLLGGAESTAEGMELLKSGHFYGEDCRRAFDILAAMLGNSAEINEPTFLKAWRETFSDSSEKPFIHLIREVMDKIPSQAMIAHYADEIAEAAKRRRLFFSAHGILGNIGDRTKSVDALIAAAENDLLVQDISSVPYFNGAGCASALIDDLEARHARQGQPTGILTGFVDLDNKIDGLQAGEQTVIGARPGIGKTAIGLCIANRACLQDGIPTLFVTLEMNKEALLRRLVSINCSVPMFTLRKGCFTEEHMPKIVAFHQKIHHSKLHVLDAVGGADDQELGAAIRRKIRQHGIKLVVVDYLQKVRAAKSHEKRTYEVAQVSGTLKGIAARCNVAMVTLAQLNRESEKTTGQFPRLGDLADSGQIERDADLVLLLHRNRDEANGEAALFISKNRDGEMGVVPLIFDGRHCRFTSKSKIADEDVPPPQNVLPLEQPV